MARPGLIASPVVILMMAISALGAGREPANADKLQKQIRDVLDAQVAGWNRGDLEVFMHGYWRSPRLSFFSGANKLAGWEQTLDRYRQRYQSEGREMGTLEFSNIEVEFLGPRSAFVTGKWQLKMKSGEASGLFTLVFKRFAQGWKIVHDHTSAS